MAPIGEPSRRSHPRINGTGRSAKKNSRFSFTYAFKLEGDLLFLLVRLGERNALSLLQGSDTSSSTRTIVDKWVTSRARIKHQSSNNSTTTHRRARPAGSGMTLPHDVEAALVKWTNNLRRGGVPVSAAILHDQARELTVDGGISSEMFSASWQWRDPSRSDTAPRFERRHTR
ncbi:hypothetical protein PybrP1_006487 [[Pythium] brassicae (nom. inval.)]|nr:hypothetical protein PybrP1_006487 [[Pythium] brassicae (nom. inval.)]